MGKTRRNVTNERTMLKRPARDAVTTDAITMRGSVLVLVAVGSMGAMLARTAYLELVAAGASARSSSNRRISRDT